MLEHELLDEDEVVRAAVEDDDVHDDDDDELEDVELEELEVEDVDELEELDASSSCRPIRYRS